MRADRILLLLLAVVCGSAEDRQILVILRRPAEASTPQVEVQTAPAERRGIYDRFYNDPEQFYVDSPEGPMPLWGADLVYDKDGTPIPRYPDPFTKALIENPDDEGAYRRWLAWRMVLLRRARITGDRLKDVAMSTGILSPDVLKIPESHELDMAIGATNQVDPKSLGTPALSEEQAHELGLKPGEVPRTPGQPNEVELIWIWDKDCPYCESMARDWFYVARDVTAAGYKAVSVTNDQDTGDISAKLQFWAIRWPVFASTNLWDWTDLYRTMHVSATPTVLLFNRKTGDMRRHEGVMSEEQLRAFFLDGAKLPLDQWPPAPNPVAVAEASAAADAALHPGGATPLPGTAPASPSTAEQDANLQATLEGLLDQPASLSSPVRKETP